MSDISLSAGIRSNLNQLQQSSSLFNRTVDRLSSGKKVNSAIDNPTNFFASINLNDRASGLESRLDSMGQAIQRIQSADNGISTIRGFVSAMKGVVNNALGNTDADSRDALGRQFNELIVQISEVAKDSGYAGVNLLERNETEIVQFNETFDASVLNVRGFDLVGPGDDGRGRADTNGEVASASNISDAVIGGAANSIASQSSIASDSGVNSVSATGYSATDAGASVTLDGDSGYTALAATESGYDTNGATFSGAGATGFSVSTVAGFTASAATNTTVAVSVGGSAYTEVAGNTNSVTVGEVDTIGTSVSSEAIGTSAVASQAAQASQASEASGTFTGAAAIVLQDQSGTKVGIRGANDGATSGMVDWGGDNYKTQLAGVITELERFDDALKTQASDLAQNLATITTREEFTNNLISTLTEGSDKLTLADLNEEGANLLALQTSSQLATQSLSLASQQSQQVLQLLG